MSSYKEHFEIPARYKQWSLGLMTVGVISLIVGFILYGTHDQGTRFWATLMHNSVYFLLITNAAMFFFCAVTLSLGNFIITFRRVTEAISAAVIPIGIICFVILMCIVFGGHTAIYSWLDRGAVAKDELLKEKSGFLSVPFFTIWTILTIGLWISSAIRCANSPVASTRPRLAAKRVKNISLRTPSGRRYISFGLRSPWPRLLP